MPDLIRDGDQFFVEPEGGERVEVVLGDGFVSAEDVREGYVPKSYFQSELERRVTGAKKGLTTREAVLGDESILDDVISTHRDTLVQRLAVQPRDADLAAVREKVLEQEVTPLRTEIEGLQGTITGLRDQGFRADFADAARSVGVDDEVADLVRLYVRERAAWSEEAGAWIIVDKDGKPELSATMGKDRSHPYQTPGDFLAEIQKSGERKSWFKARQKTGAEVGDFTGASAITLEQFEKMTSAQRTQLFQQNSELWHQLMDAKRNAGISRLTATG